MIDQQARNELLLLTNNLDNQANALVSAVEDNRWLRQRINELELDVLFLSRELRDHLERAEGSTIPA